MISFLFYKNDFVIQLITDTKDFKKFQRLKRVEGEIQDISK